jgi:hypothetical protein
VADALAECLSNPSWVLARVERLWSQLAPRKQAGEVAAVAVDAVRPRRELPAQCKCVVTVDPRTNDP